MKTIVITGGNGDIAKAIQQRLDSNSEYNILTPSRSELDITKTEDVKKYFSDKKVDVLINAAGYIQPHYLKEFEFKDDFITIDTNLTGLFYCSSIVINKNPEAIIINIGSSSATKPRGQWASYCASKAAVVMATKCWADEGVKAICLSPGRTKTKMRKKLFPDESYDDLMRAEDFAKVVEKAINSKFQWGENINVNVNNIKDYE